MNAPTDRLTAGQAPAPVPPFRRVLVAWEGSADSVAALHTASALVGGQPGHVVESGSTEKLFTAPDDPRTADYVHGRFG